MKRVEYKKGWEDFFRSAGMRTFDEFFDYSDGPVVNANTKRNVTAMTLGTNGRQKEFFMKRYFSPHFKDMLFTVASYGRVCSQAMLEYKNAMHLLNNGIDTYIPVCLGEEKLFGIERRSFLVTEKLDGFCLADIVRAKWQSLAPADKENLMTQLGGFIRKIHNARISMPDLYLWHIFIRPAQSPAEGMYDFAVIDLHRMKPDTGSENEFVKNLARLDFSMPDIFFDDALRRILLSAYLSGSPGCSVDALWRNVRRYSAKLAKRRTKPVC